MSSEYAEGGAAAPTPQRRPGRGGDGGAPVTGALTIVLAVVAVVAGFLILRAITGDDGGTSVGPGTTQTTEPAVDPAATTTTVPQSTTTTEPPLVFDGATVVVANANNVNGSAGQMTRELEAAGFTLGGAVNAATAVGQLATTVIYFDSSVESARAVAESVNRVLGADSSISPLPETPPTADGTLDGQVLVMLGNDKAGRTLDELAPEPAADVVPSPGVSGDGTEGDDAVDPDEDPDG